MKTVTKSPMRSTDELWQWAALKRSAEFSSKYPAAKTFRFSCHDSTQMAQGILVRLRSILRDTCRLGAKVSLTRR